MNRIPTEGLKRIRAPAMPPHSNSLNEQNPDRGIETLNFELWGKAPQSLNEQNPDRGIETTLGEPPHRLTRTA